MTTELPRAAAPASRTALAALTAVLFWSLSPVLITIIGDRASYAEVYLAATSMSVVVSLLGCAVRGRSTANLLRGGRTALIAAGNAVLSGAFLAVWYYGYYKALYGASKVDVTVIAFTWPLISILAVKVFSRQRAKPLTLPQIALMALAFIGAAVVGLSSTESAASATDPTAIYWAFAAAIGSGLYLPFAMNAANGFADLLGGPRTMATFYSISVANAASLCLVYTLLTVRHTPLRFEAFNAPVLATCAALGVGTYLIAEITWTWAYSEHASLSLSSLPYFTPAVSIALLYLFFHEPVSQMALFGLIIILFSNLTLHGNRQSFNAISLSAAATVYVTLVSQAIPQSDGDTVTQFLGGTTGLFAILAGFILARVSGRRSQEAVARSHLVRLITDDLFPRSPSRADAALCALSKNDFAETAAIREEATDELRGVMRTIPDAALRSQLMGAFDEWHVVSRDRISSAERAAVWITGIASVVFAMMSWDRSSTGMLGIATFAAGASLTMFTIRDYEQNNLHGLRQRIDDMEHAFEEIGRPIFVPPTLSAEGAAAKALSGRARRTVHDGSTVLLPAEPPAARRSTFMVVYITAAAAAIALLVAFPLVSLPTDLRSSVKSQRPGAVEPGTSSSSDAIVVADPGWPAAQVTSQVVKQLLHSKLGVNAKVEQVPDSQVIEQLRSKDGADVHPDLWLENHDDAQLSTLLTGHSLRLNSHPYTASQGFYAAGVGADGLQVASLQALDTPQIAAKFDTDGDGRGEIWLGDPTWTSTAALRKRLDSLHLRYWEPEAYSRTVLLARIGGVTKDAHGLLFYGYAPDSLETNPRVHRVMTLPTDLTGGSATCPKGSPDPCSENAVHVHVAYRSELTTTYPDAARLLDAVTFTTADVAFFIKQVEAGKSAEDVASRWISSHQDQVDHWRATAR